MCLFANIYTCFPPLSMTGADDPDLSVTLTRSKATLRNPDLLYIIYANGGYFSQAVFDNSFPLWHSVCAAESLKIIWKALKLPNSVLVRVPINIYYYEQIIPTLFVILVETPLACHLFGIHLPGTELLDSLVRTQFSTGLFHAVFIWLSTEFSSSCRDQQVWHHGHCNDHGVACQCSNLVHC